MIKGVTYRRQFTVKLNGTATNADATPSARLLISGVPATANVVVTPTAEVGVYEAVVTPLQTDTAGQNTCLHVSGLLGGRDFDIPLACGVLKSLDAPDLYRSASVWITPTGVNGVELGVHGTYDNPLASLSAAASFLPTTGFNTIEARGFRGAFAVTGEAVDLSGLKLVGSNTTVNLNVGGLIRVPDAEIKGVRFVNAHRITGADAGVSVYSTTFQDSTFQFTTWGESLADHTFISCSFRGQTLVCNHLVARTCVFDGTSPTTITIADTESRTSHLTDCRFLNSLSLRPEGTNQDVYLTECQGDVSINCDGAVYDGTIHVIGGTGNIILDLVPNASRYAVIVTGRNKDSIIDNSGGAATIQYFDKRGIEHTDQLTIAETNEHTQPVC